jgi:hypothetical protein
LKNFSKKLAIAAIPAVMALSAPQAESKILLMSQEGWEVSFDGAANAFIMKNSAEATVADGKGASDVATFQTEGGVMTGGDDEVGIVTGLLPNVWGMTLKAPTNNGLDMQARLGLYTHMNGGNNALGNGVLNIRETNFSVSGSFGTILVGRSLGIHQSSAILNDMLLFGVGAASSADNSGTTLGRIGLGYLYADFQPQITWTTPGVGPFGVKIGLFDPNDVTSTETAADATDKTSPRVEAQITYSGTMSDLGIDAWVDGSYQNTEFTAAAANLCSGNDGAVAGTGTPTAPCTDVNSAGVAFGTKLSYNNLALVASGWYGQGMGMRGQHSEGALDGVGKEYNSYGGYLQGTADLGGGTNIGYSYGGNWKLQTGDEINSNTIAEVNFQDMHSAMLWHKVNDSLWVIAEGGYTRQAFHMGGSYDDVFGGVGGFFFW